ncbi:MAG: hypothetical protein ACKOAO_00060 [Oxalobacteraceae bacterium]
MTMIRLALTRYALIISAMLATSTLAAETLEQALSKRFPQGSITSVTAARQALSDLDAARREAEQSFSDERMRCYDKFFTASCLSEAKETRRLALTRIRKVEVEANAFLRKEKAAERDRVIAERQGRAARPLEGPAIPITGAARDGGATPDAETQPDKP